MVEGEVANGVETGSVVEDSSKNPLLDSLNGDCSIPVVSSSNNQSFVHGLDWVLTQHDERKSEPQSLDEELHRLQALRSYLILDSDREYPFERLTAFASRVMDVPIALGKSKWCVVCPLKRICMSILISNCFDHLCHTVSLVDLGRQWFMSNRGLGDVRETPRSQAFCAHAISSLDDIFTIPDATKDPRFAQNPLVTGPPHIRFYAGAPLLAPEGYKLGTFCIIDTKPGPAELDLEFKQNLSELSALAVEVLVTRRKKRERESNHNAQLIACTAHDLLTPLSGIELSLSLLREDDEFQQKLKDGHKEGLVKASTCSDVLQEICKNVKSTFSDAKNTFEIASIQAELACFKVDNLVNRLYTVMESFPKKTPLRIEVDANVPSEIVADAAKIFRCAMNYLTIACSRTKEGSVALHFFIRENSDKRKLLVVKCEDSGPPVDLEKYQYLFKPFSGNLEERKPSADDSEGISDDQGSVDINPGLALFSVASLMNLVGGEFGFRPRGTDDEGRQELDENGNIAEGSVFWFCVPVSRPARTTPDKTPESNDIPTLSHMEASKFHQAISDILSGPEEVAISQEPVVERRYRALVIEDSTVVRKMLKKILEKLGYEVSQATNGMEGLKELQGSLFELTLCDFLMPVMDGLDCVQQYRTWERVHRPWFSQRIIGISAHASDSDIEKGLSVGMDAYKPKPVTLKHLSELERTEEQMMACKRLDEIERHGLVSSCGQLEQAGEDEKARKKAKLSHTRLSALPNGKNRRILSGLILTPTVTSHMQLVGETMKSNGWQSAVAQNNNEALNLLRMRTWDIVLVDEMLSNAISEFRIWETRHRTDRQSNVILMSESMVQDGPQRKYLAPPLKGFDNGVGKPIPLTSLESLLGKIERSCHVEDND